MVSLHLELSKEKFIKYILNNSSDKFNLTFIPYMRGARIEILIDLQINEYDNKLFHKLIKDNEDDIKIY